MLIHIFAWLTPGPNIVLIIRNSLIYSRRTGFFTAVGFAISNCIHILVAVTGISLIISRSSLAHNSIKFLGVGYLMYLGFKTFFTEVKPQALKSHEKHDDIPPIHAVKTGFVTNILSPKAPLFFGSIFGALISSGSPRWVVIFLMIVMPLNTLLMANLWSIFFTQKSISNLYKRFQSTFNKFLGGVLILLALIIAFSKR